MRYHRGYYRSYRSSYYPPKTVKAVRDGATKAYVNAVRRLRKAMASLPTNRPLTSIERGWLAMVSRNPYEDRLGYSTEAYMLHIETRFEPGMNWDNHGQWHVDHIAPHGAICPMSVNSEEFRNCWSLINLRPLWASENMKDGKTKRRHRDYDWYRKEGLSFEEIVARIRRGEIPWKQKRALKRTMVQSRSEQDLVSDYPLLPSMRQQPIATVAEVQAASASRNRQDTDMTAQITAAELVKVALLYAMVFGNAALLVAKQIHHVDGVSIQDELYSFLATVGVCWWAITR